MSSDTPAYGNNDNLGQSFLRRPGSISSSKERLGHESLATTQKYTHLDLARLREVYRKSHPPLLNTRYFGGIISIPQASLCVLDPVLMSGRPKTFNFRVRERQ